MEKRGEKYYNSRKREKEGAIFASFTIRHSHPTTPTHPIDTKRESNFTSCTKLCPKCVCLSMAHFLAELCARLERREEGAIARNLSLYVGRLERRFSRHSAEIVLCNSITEESYSRKDTTAKRGESHKCTQTWKEEEMHSCSCDHKSGYKDTNTQ